MLVEINEQNLQLIMRAACLDSEEPDIEEYLFDKLFRFGHFIHGQFETVAAATRAGNVIVLYRTVILPEWLDWEDEISEA